MYAIRSRKTKRWYAGVDARYGSGSSHYLRMDPQVPLLFHTLQEAKTEILVNKMHASVFEILEVELCQKA